MNQRISRFSLAILLCACLPLAQAQWIWVNEKGVKQLSDLPPPPGTPPSRILKAPHSKMMDLRVGEEAEAPPAAEAPARPTLAQRNADYNKRREEAAEQQSKAREDAQRNAEKANYCAEARQNIATLESGTRIAQTGAGGEREFMSDDQRAARLRDARAGMSKHCN